MKRLSSLLIVTAFTLVFVSGCSSKNDQKVNVYEMEDFSKIKEDSMVSFKDPEVFNDFVKAFMNAERIPGITDMSEPAYKVELGEQSFYLWISEESGSVMNLKDTHTVYRLSESSVKTINGILNQ